MLPQWNPRPTIPELSTPVGPHALLLFILLFMPHYVLNLTLFFSSSLPSTLSFSLGFFFFSSLGYTLLSLYISRAFSFLVSQQNSLLHRKERHASYTLISRFTYIKFVILTIVFPNHTIFFTQQSMSTEKAEGTH